MSQKLDWLVPKRKICSLGTKFVDPDPSDRHYFAGFGWEPRASDPDQDTDSYPFQPIVKLNYNFCIVKNLFIYCPKYWPEPLWIKFQIVKISSLYVRFLPVGSHSKADLLRVGIRLVIPKIRKYIYAVHIFKNSYKVLFLPSELEDLDRRSLRHLAEDWRRHFDSFSPTKKPFQKYNRTNNSFPNSAHRYKWESSNA